MTQNKDQFNTQNQGNTTQGSGGQTQGSQDSSQSGSQSGSGSSGNQTGRKKQLSDYTQSEIDQYRQNNPNWQPGDEVGNKMPRSGTSGGSVSQ